MGKNPTSKNITDAEWRKMIAKRRKNELPDADREMVEAFINGKEAWQQWQNNNQDITEYDFQYLTFLHVLNLARANFTKDANFEEASFTKPVFFMGANFTKEAYFRQASFTQHTNFMRTTFKGTADFVSTTFNQNAHFMLAKFNEKANFFMAEFNQWAYFREVTFTQSAVFERASFKESVNFTGVTFTQSADFNQASFTQSANFVGTTFKGTADFVVATFEEKAHFMQAKFNQLAYFSGATFKEFASFSWATFTQSADFSLSRFADRALFNNSQFHGEEIDFSKTIFKENLILEEAKFSETIPDFRHMVGKPDIRLHDVTILSPLKKIFTKIILLKRFIIKKIFNSKFRKSNFPRVKSICYKPWQPKYEDQYRKLKEMAIDNHNHEYELRFYGYELLSNMINFFGEKKFLKPLAWFGFLYKFFYFVLSNFGQSILLPLSWFGVLTYILKRITNVEWSKTLHDLFPFPPYSSYNEFFTLDYVAWLIAAKLLASILLFLLLLGIRNNFKIK